MSSGGMTFFSAIATICDLGKRIDPQVKPCTRGSHAIPRTRFRCLITAKMRTWECFKNNSRKINAYWLVFF